MTAEPVTPELSARIEQAVDRTIARVFAPYFNAAELAVANDVTGSGVYIVASAAVLGSVKVGRSIDVETRIQQLSGSSVHAPFVPVGFVPVPEHLIAAVEGLAHRRLHHLRMNAGREFFRCHSAEGLQEIVAVVSGCADEVLRELGQRGEEPGAAFKRSRQFCAMFTQAEAAKIEQAIELGHYATPSDLIRDAIERRLREIDDKPD